MTDAILTAIVPIGKAYDGLQFLKQWVNDARNLPISIILVIDTDDQSTCEQTSVITSANERRVSVIRSVSVGPGGARNTGLQNVTTEWVCFWDSDDLAFPQLALEAINAAKKQSKDVVIANYKVLEKKQEISKIQKKESYSSLDLAIDPGIWRFIFKIERIRGLTFPELFLGEDLVFLAKCADALAEAHVSQLEIYRYTKGVSTQLTSSKMFLSQLESCNSILKNLENQTTSKFGQELIMHMKLKLKLTLIKRGGLELKLAGFVSFFEADLKKNRMKQIELIINYIVRIISKRTFNR